jgi:hypothetical protein
MEKKKKSGCFQKWNKHIDHVVTFSYIKKLKEKKKEKEKKPIYLPTYLLRPNFIFLFNLYTKFG